jgi:hypothetical protein
MKDYKTKKKKKKPKTKQKKTKTKKKEEVRQAFEHNIEHFLFQWHCTNMRPANFRDTTESAIRK